MALCLEVFCWEVFKCGGILLGGIFLWRDFARGFFLRRDLSLEGFLLIAKIFELSDKKAVFSLKKTAFLSGSSNFFGPSYLEVALF